MVKSFERTMPDMREGDGDRRRRGKRRIKRRIKRREREGKEKGKRRIGYGYRESVNSVIVLEGAI